MNASKSELRSIIGRLLGLLDASHSGYAPLTDETRDLLERAKLAAAATDDGPRIPLDATEAEILEWLNAKADSYDLPGLRFTFSTWTLGRDSARQLQILAVHDAAPTGFASADTLDGAVAAVRAKIETPEKKAARLRQEAAKLLEEAKAMETPQP